MTGNISTRAEVDCELSRKYRLVVRCTTESESETAVFAVVIVNVNDVNEYRPVFPVPVYRRTLFGAQVTSLAYAAYF